MGGTGVRVLSAIVKAVDGLNEWVGRVTSWLVLSMVINTFLVATLRYGFNLGWVWLQELYVWMHGTTIMVAAGYTFLHDGHVRVDIVYQAISRRAKAWVNLIGTIFLLFPTLAAVIWVAWPYVMLSWHRLETSREAGGMPGLFLWKTTILVFCALMFLQGLALICRSLLVLGGRETPNETAGQAAREA